MPGAEKNRVVVTGAAGFLGQTVVRRLSEIDREVVAVDRGHADSTPPMTQRVTADVRDEVAMRSALVGASAVIHAAFAPPQAGEAELREVNVDAVARLTRVAIDAGVPRLVVVSSTIVERTSRRHPLSSRFPLSRLDTYRRTRIEAEQTALAFSDEISVSIARPCTFVGPGRIGAFALMFEAVRAGGFVPILGSGNNRYQLLHVEDLAHALVLLATSSGPHGVFHIGASNVVSVRELLESLAHHADTGARVVSVPTGFARATVRAIELAGLPPLSDWHHATARAEDRCHDLADMASCGWSPAFSNQECLSDAYDWYVRTRNAGQTARTTHPVPVSHRLIARATRLAGRRRP